jgi:hypothetical protein
MKKIKTVEAHEVQNEKDISGYRKYLDHSIASLCNCPTYEERA